MRRAESGESLGSQELETARNGADVFAFERFAHLKQGFAFFSAEFVRLTPRQGRIHSKSRKGLQKRQVRRSCQARKDSAIRPPPAIFPLEIRGILADLQNKRHIPELNKSNPGGSRGIVREG